jgi:hypothetical protein
MIENLPNIAEAFKEAAKTSLEFAGEVIHYSAKYYMAHFIAAVIGGLVVQRSLSNKLKTGNFRNDNTHITYTDYVATGQNMQIGSRPEPVELMEQKITTGNQFELEHVYHGRVGKKIVKYILEASKRTSDENPIVLSALIDELRGKVSNDNKVSDEKRLNFKEKIAQALVRPIVSERNPDARGSVFNLLKSEWINYFSSVFNADKKDILAQHLGDREDKETVRKYAVLVYENGARKKQLRTLIISEEQLKDEYKLPDRDQILIDGRYDPLSNQLERRDTLERVIKRLRDDADLREFCGFNVLTGRIRTIPEPK